MFNGMKDMACTPMEQEGKTPEAAGKQYPYNLSLTLTPDIIEKLGLDCSDEDCEVGSYLHLHGLAEVTGVHKTAGGNSINLQFTHLKAEDEDSENDEADDEMDGVA